MSDSSAFFRSGGKPRVLRVTTSGTFTPSDALLGKGGVVTITASGGAGSGALIRISSGVPQSRASGGDAGQRVRRTVVLTGPVTYTIGAGGAARSATGTSPASLSGNNGGDTVVTGILTAKGGLGGFASSDNTACRGGNGAAGLGMSACLVNTASSSVMDARGGPGIDGCNGGGGGTVQPVGTYGSTGMSAQDGAGAGLILSAVTTGTVNGNNAEAGTGAGGGATSIQAAISENVTCSSGAGAGGWIEFAWTE